MSNDLAAQDYVAEVRFGVVMYGGVSLAVYINGVSHEIFEMCCSTPLPGVRIESTSTDGTRDIYERLSWLAGDPALVAKYYEALRARRPGDDKDVWELPPSSANRVRFVVDAIAGTSAGGINGVFLAKALVNGEQFGVLRDLWIREGDIGRLLNDKQSWEGLPQQIAATAGEPRSLLNSDRMYLKLLDALHGMESLLQQRAPSERSPLIEEFDLVLTTTDLRGTPMQLQLFDKVVNERRHKQRFALKYRGETLRESDFATDRLPFLAFVARCTSSFPFAFEPMTLSRVSALVSDCKETALRSYDRYFEAFEPRMVARGEHLGLPFSDGGTLDNKPFSYVTEVLSRRFGDPPGRRKLFYVEPDPEWLDATHDSRRGLDPDAVSTALDALFTIPMYETIREDLDAVLARNRRIERVEGLVYQVEAAIEADAGQRGNPFAKVRLDERGQVPAWRSLKEDAMVTYFGRAVLPYRQLRVYDVTDRLAQQLASAWGQETVGDRFQALRGLVRWWREAGFSERSEEAHRCKPFNEFLYRFDFDYRVRRLGFILRRIDRLRALLRLPLRTKSEPQSLDDTLRQSLLRHWSATSNPNKAEEPDPATRDSATVALGHLKRALRKVYQEMQAWRDGALALQDERKNLPSQLDATLDEVLKVLPSTHELTPVERVAVRLRDLAEDAQVITLQSRVEKAMAALDIEEQDDSDDATKLPSGHAHHLTTEVWQLLGRPKLKASGQPSIACLDVGDARDFGNRIDPEALVTLSGISGKWVLHVLGETFLMFDQFDQTRFTMYYGTDTGEPAQVDVIRISPVDAVGLLCERPDMKPEERKLAGTGLAHFGAFLEERWRRNDAMWGRLDGAERLITALLPPLNIAAQEVHKELLSIAQRRILRETLVQSNRAELTSLLMNALADVPGRGIAARLQALLDLLRPDRASERKVLAEFLATLLNESKLQKHLRDNHRLNLEPDAQATLNNVARAVTVVGKVLEGVSESNATGTKAARWIARGGSVLNALVTVSVPKSLRQLWWSRSVMAIYSMLGVLLAISLVFGSPDLRTASISASLVVVATHIATLVFRDRMRGRHVALRVLTGVVLLAMAVLMALGLWGTRQNGIRSMLCGPTAASSNSNAGPIVEALCKH